MQSRHEAVEFSRALDAYLDGMQRYHDLSDEQLWLVLRSKADALGQQVRA